MSNYRKHIDQFFREKLGSYREAPPADVWESLESRLDGLAPMPTPGMSYRWMWHAAIVCVIVFLGVSVMKKFTSTPATDDRTALNVSSTATNNSTNNAANNNANTTAQVTTPGSNDNNNNNSNTNAVPVAAGTTDQQAQDNKQDNRTQNKTAYQSSRKDDTRGKENTKGRHTPTVTNYNTNPGKNNSNKTNAIANNNTVYNSNSTTNLSNPAPAETNTNDQVTNASPNTTLSVVSKTDLSQKTKKPGTPIVQNAGNNGKPKPSFARLFAGVKLGFEGGMSNKAVVAPYLQYNISPKVGIMTQPAIKAANAPDRNIGNPQQYYRVVEGGKITQNTTTSNIVIGGIPTTVYNTVYTYTETHDSIVKTNKAGGNYMEFELPVLINYSISKKLSVYGGVNMVYSDAMGITEKTYTAHDITRSYSTAPITTTDMPTAADQPAMGFTYTGKPYANYTGPITPADKSSKVRAGYMIGLSYTYHNKWLFDGLMEQSPAKADVKNGYDINSPLSTPYFRFSIGYKLTK